MGVTNYLSPEQIQQFHKDGILVVKGFLKLDDVEAMRAAMMQLVDEMDPAEHHGEFSTTENVQMNDAYFIESGDKVRYFFEKGVFDEQGNLKQPKDTCLNKVGHALHFRVPAFEKVTFSDEVKAVARDLDFQDPVVVQGMYIFKQPGIGGEVVPHQDGTYLRNDPLKLMGYWFPIDDATLDNGCLWFVPGSHKHPVTLQMIRNPMYGSRDDGTEPMLIYEGDKLPEFPEHQWVPAPVARGDLVLIDGAVVHRSAKNLSDKPRHAFTFHLVETAGCTYRKTNWLQPSKESPFKKLMED